MMARVLRSHQAERDLVSIILNVGRHSRQAARKLATRIEQICTKLAANPMMGAACDEVRAGLRYFVVGKYVIYYLPMTDGIQVVRVLHGAQDLTFQSFEDS
jgi:toxin ParE1/3/4